MADLEEGSVLYLPALDQSILIERGINSNRTKNRVRQDTKQVFLFQRFTGKMVENDTCKIYEGLFFFLFFSSGRALARCISTYFISFRESRQAMGKSQ